MKDSNTSEPTSPAGPRAVTETDVDLLDAPDWVTYWRTTRRTPEHQCPERALYCPTDAERERFPELNRCFAAEIFTNKGHLEWRLHDDDNFETARGLIFEANHNEQVGETLYLHHEGVFTQTMVRYADGVLTTADDCSFSRRRVYDSVEDALRADESFFWVTDFPSDIHTSMFSAKEIASRLVLESHAVGKAGEVILNGETWQVDVDGNVSRSLLDTNGVAE